ncbi:flagellar basal-body MS-ring/collar protein FliF [Clostridium omnivorum]|uniref:Flagellar M-ring protein n=1 Tax=Clostridium omnivorum TaxID=1604902 RepID=A0ABQ5NB92_9CLOT|nr:flagellar basal-body MS-ring/collar protein FliF [Clostridium sp. E14]GLC32349.1 flagellar M-ring protein [Clostridium sp. E14]
MGKLSELFNSLKEKWLGISKGKKIASIVTLVGVITALIYLTVSLNSVKYSVLFSDLDAKDSKTIVDKLKEQKVTNVKIQGNSILVPSDQVDSLRLTLAPDISDGSSGWELFDNTSQFGITDAEMQVKYQRALQGELEKTIKSFPQVDKAKVALVMPEDSVFVKDSTPASASVTLLLKSGQKLNEEQVKSIVALVSGSVKNLPKENVQVIDNNMTLLTKDLYNNDNIATSNTANEKQQQMKKEYEKYLEDKAMAVLGKAYKDKVGIKINADLNFDANKTVSTTYDPKGTVVSEQKKYDANPNGTSTQTSQSPVDNNMVNGSASTTTNANGTIVHSEEINNYQVGSTQQETIKAPGDVKRLTASVIVDGNLDEATRSSIKNLVSAAVGINDTRGDVVSVEGLAFDTTAQNQQKKDLQALQQEQDKENRMKIYTYAGIGAGILLLVIIAAIALRKKNKKEAPEGEFEDFVSAKGIDVVIGDEEKKEKIEFEPIDFDNEAMDEKKHIEKEIKKYASEKPEQVVDIIKSWLAEDER